MSDVQSAQVATPVRYGSRAMRFADLALVRRWLHEPHGAPCVLTDPDPANTNSIAAFSKAGFRALETHDTPWGHVLLMRCDRPVVD
jgi:hypothetical protein